jgi:hypothetical protein
MSSRAARRLIAYRSTGRDHAPGRPACRQFEQHSLLLSAESTIGPVSVSNQRQTGTPTVTTSFSLQPELVNGVKALAREKGTSASAQVAAALDAFLREARESKDVPEFVDLPGARVPLVSCVGYLLPGSTVAGRYRIAAGNLNFGWPLSAVMFSELQAALPRVVHGLWVAEGERRSGGRPARG